jgi:periplasmic protein TonB
VSLPVDRVLERRAQRAGRPEALSLMAAALLHGVVIAVVLLAPRLTPPPPPLSFVPVQIIPAQALGVRRPASRPRVAKPPSPEPPTAPEPERPAPEPEREDVPVLPPEKPETRPDKPKPAETATTARRPGEAAPENPQPAVPGTPDGEAGRRGAPTGSSQGTSAFGSAIAGLDNPDFRFGYYLDQLLSAIDAKWVRPPLGDGVQAIISFRIERDGSISDLQVAESSGYNSFDLAALRAVQNASPFPPLPRAYRHDSLGVNLIVR